MLTNNFKIKVILQVEVMINFLMILWVVTVTNELFYTLNVVEVIA